MSFTVAIIGRPNVGKSTLFNRLIGKRLALVAPTPGLTRDRREGEARLGDLRFTVIDTAGLEDAKREGLEARMREQTERALDDADLALLLIDARAGVTPLDGHFADWLRRRGTPALLVANKCEARAGRAGLFEAYELGLGEPIAISAEHGDGMVDLLDALRPYAEEAPEAAAEEAVEGEAERPLRLAVVGRPNVGKSTMVNRLVGTERMLTGPEAGITRDAVSISCSYRGRAIRLVDTAGLRRKARISEKLEALSVGDAERAIRFAHVVVLLVDGTRGLERQDLTIASAVVDEGRALVIGLNKWDLVSDPSRVRQRLARRLEASLPQARGIPVVPCSALTGRGIDKLMAAVFKTYEVWNRRIATGPLNRWLEAVGERHPPPLARGRRIRLRYLTQAKARPPTFVLFASRPEALPESYLRYLVNNLRQAFDLPGVPIRLYVRKGKRQRAKG